MRHHTHTSGLGGGKWSSRPVAGQPGAAVRRVLGVVVLAAVAGCELTVSNPGPVQDDFLQDPAAHEAIVNGMGRTLAIGLNWVSYTGAAITRELHPAGSTGSFGISPLQQVGVLEFDDLHIDDNWQNAQRARWVAEDGVRRLREALGGAAESSARVAQGHLWIGYANRLLGENMCEAVIDGGPAQPRSEYLNRAEANFTQAMEVAGRANRPDLATAARAGRASVRLHLGNWAGAVTDAADVPTGFAYRLPYFDLGVQAEHNRIHFASANAPYRAHTVWNTVNEQYFLDTGDPRVRWQPPTAAQPQTGDAAVAHLGRVPWFVQLKHNARIAPITLSSGREMRLIEAENHLRSGDWAAAMTAINGLRAAVGVAGWPAASAEDAWRHLKRERGIELWLEGRRLGDLRRWNEANTPGALHPLESQGGELALRADRSYCFPISRSERETNPNL